MKGFHEGMLIALRHALRRGVSRCHFNYQFKEYKHAKGNERQNENEKYGHNKKRKNHGNTNGPKKIKTSLNNALPVEYTQ